MEEDLTGLSFDRTARRLLAVNMVIAGFVLLAHGGAAAVSLSEGSEELGEIASVVSVTIPAGAFVFITGIIALLWQKLRRPVLTIHAVLLVLGAGALLVWALFLLVGGLPESGRFSWTPGLLTLFCAYPAYLLRKTLLDRRAETSRLLRNIHWIVALAVLPVDLGVMVRLVLHMSQLWSQLGN